MVVTKARDREREGTKMKPNPAAAAAAMRGFGQASLQSSLFSRSSDDTHPNPKRPISLSEFLDRKLGKSSCRSIQEKPRAFSSVGWQTKREETGGGGGSTLSVFQKLGSSSTKEVGDMGMMSSEEGGGLRLDSARKRKNPSDFTALTAVDAEKPKLAEKEKNSISLYKQCDHQRAAAPKSLVILGDDPKPRPKKRGKSKFTDQRSKPLYNHYENGCGLWDGDREGVDNEEVGCNQVWEGMGSTTLGGLQWH